MIDEVGRDGTALEVSQQRGCRTTSSDPGRPAGATLDDVFRKLNEVRKENPIKQGAAGMHVPLIRIHASTSF
jgi:hypothetical protein